MTRTLTLRNRYNSNTTTVENEFIDFYMTKANGEYVKVYLLLLRHLNAEDQSVSISKMADWLECTEKDVLRALNYWHDAGLLKIDYDGAGNICGLNLGKTPKQTAPAAEAETVLPKKTAVRSKSSENQAELRQLYFVTEQYMAKPLTASDIKKINYFFDELCFSVELIEYLIEYCVENGHKSMHYIEKVAQNWSDAGITSVTQAKEQAAAFNSFSKNNFAILNAFGIKGRSPAALELEFIRRWTDEYGFTLDIILEACNRTIANTHKADFKYTDSILKNWSVNNVHYLSDIARLDKVFQQGKEVKKSTAKPAAANRFNNFENRPYDISSLEAQLLNSN